VYFLSQLNEPGYLKAYEGTFFPSFIMGFFVFIVVFFLLLLIGYAGNRLLAASRKNKEG
jgi:uncharacterized membrane protein